MQARPHPQAFSRLQVKVLIPCSAAQPCAVLSSRRMIDSKRHCGCVHGLALHILRGSSTAIGGIIEYCYGRPVLISKEFLGCGHRP